MRLPAPKPFGAGILRPAQIFFRIFVREMGRKGNLSISFLGDIRYNTSILAKLFPNAPSGGRQVAELPTCRSGLRPCFDEI